MLIGDKVKDLRNAKKMTQEELAKIIGVSTSMVGMYETNARKPSFKTLVKIANFFNVLTDYLLGKTPFKTQKEAECSIRVTAMKMLISYQSINEYIKKRILADIETDETLYTNETLHYLLNLTNKENLTNVELYDLSLFVVWEIDWPADLDGPAIISTWDSRTRVTIDYWRIQKITIEKWQSNVKYKEVTWYPELGNVTKNDRKDFSASVNNVPLYKSKKVPMLGKIAAGEPMYVAEEPCEYYVEVDENLHVDYCLKVQGDSMIDARVHDEDIVFIRKQPMVENGEIAAVMIDDEVTLKRFYKNDGGVILKPENSKYQPKYYTEEDFKDIRVLGKAILFQSKL